MVSTIDGGHYNPLHRARQGSQTGRIPSEDLIIRFNFWSDRQGLGTWTQRTLIKELRQRGFEDARSNRQRGLRGLCLS
jgi:putative DNA primase/helicase